MINPRNLRNSQVSITNELVKGARDSVSECRIPLSGLPPLVVMTRWSVPNLGQIVRGIQVAAIDSVKTLQGLVSDATYSLLPGSWQ